MGVEIGHAAGARLIHEDDGESVEGFAESHYHDTNPEVEEVEVVRFARFITDVVATRKLPTSAKVTKPNVVIKVTLELVIICRKKFLESNFYRLILREQS